MDYQSILKKYDYADDKEIIERISCSSGNNTLENQDIINSIVLWKINRQIEISNSTFLKIKELKNENLQQLNLVKNKIIEILLELLNSKGVQIAMASTILKMFHPNIFPIIDQRAYRELYNQAFPKYYGKNAVFKYADLYWKYLTDCHSYNKKNCPEIEFYYLDKLLYQLDIEKGNKVDNY